jgi:hypothetical protein
MKKFYFNVLQPTVTISTYLGFCVGIIGGYLCGNRHIFIKYEGATITKKINLKHSLPLISGLICSMLFPSLLIFSPIIAIDYFGNLCTIDKTIDKINLKYLIEYKRYHQYDNCDNKYYAPSNLHVTIKKKNNIE